MHMFDNLLKNLKDINVINHKGNINPKYKVILGKSLNTLAELTRLTNFVESSNIHSIRERLYCVINSITHQILCTQCNVNPVKFCYDGRYRNTYHPFCSLKCSNNSDSVKIKKQETSQRNYGVDNPSQALQVKMRKINTSRERFGTDYPWQTTEIQKIKQDTCIKKYGVKNVFQNKETQRKQKKDLI